MNNLISVVVVTYNSSSFIIETLDSIAKQTWKEIELIITDDCSKDDTILKCKKWIEIHQSRFTRNCIIESKVNTGVSANANRGLKEASGDWISFPAGDDTLEPNCLSDNFNWIQKHPQIKVLFSYINVYKNKFHKDHFYKTLPSDPLHPKSIVAPGRSAESQYRMLLTTDRIHFTPSIFINKDILLSVGGFDERFKLLEDYPLWLNLTKKGCQLHFMDKVTVNYRIHSDAINNKGKDFLINPNYFKQEKFRRIYTYPYLPIDKFLEQRFEWFVSLIYYPSFMNKNNKLNRLILNFLTVYINPFRFIIKIKKLLFKNLAENEFYY